MTNNAGHKLALGLLLGLGALTFGSTGAFAGADDGGTKAFWMNQNPGDTAQAPTISNIPTNARANYQDDAAVRPAKRHVHNLHRYIR